jgi:hypothetical protein
MATKQLAWGQKVIQQAMERGIPEGQRIMLRHQLRNRFVRFDEHVARRIAAASPEQLARWAERVLSARTLAEVLGD